MHYDNLPIAKRVIKIKSKFDHQKTSYQPSANSVQSIFGTSFFSPITLPYLNISDNVNLILTEYID